jgi:hypothetical protein
MVNYLRSSNGASHLINATFMSLYLLLITFIL